MSIEKWDLTNLSPVGAAFVEGLLQNTSKIP